MAKNDTLTHVPASRYTNAGVKRGASNVEVIVIPTDRGTSPFAIWVITLLAVPPGQQPTSITPSAKSGSNLNTTASSQAKTGMMVYCARHPSNISLGLVKILIESRISGIKTSLAFANEDVDQERFNLSFKKSV